jgi:MFS family permease
VRSASRTSERGLDWFTFFVADIQTGFGPFLAIYLTTQKWNQADIGLVLAAGSIAGLVSQLPGGWLVDMAPSKRKAAMLAVAGIGLSALMIALWPSFLGIMAAKLLHVASSSVLGPAIAAITLGLVGHAAVGPRFGRNAQFSSIGNGLAAGVMGAVGYLISPQAVFFVTAALVPPTLLALTHIREEEVDPIRADGGFNGARPGHAPGSIALLLRKRSLLILTLCIFLFHAANAAMLPLVGTEMTVRSGAWATALIAACIVLPQLVVAVIAPTIGRLAVTIGRRPILDPGLRRAARACGGAGAQQRSGGDHRRAVVGWAVRCRAGRACAAVARRHLPRHGPLQSSAGHRRQRDRHWCRGEHHGGGLSCRKVRRAPGVRGARHHGGVRASGGSVGNAGDEARS